MASNLVKSFDLASTKHKERIFPKIYSTVYIQEEQEVLQLRKYGRRWGVILYDENEKESIFYSLSYN